MFSNAVSNIDPKIKQLEDKSVDFSIKVDKKLTEIGQKVKASKFGLTVSSKFTYLKNRVTGDHNNRNPSMEESASNLEAF